NGAIVGPPAPCFWRVCGSVMPKKGVSSAPEHVVGTDTWTSEGRSAYEAPGAPDSCTSKSQTASARSAQDPPPKDTTAAIASRRAPRPASRTPLVGTWASASAKLEA